MSLLKKFSDNQKKKKKIHFLKLFFSISFSRLVEHHLQMKSPMMPSVVKMVPDNFLPSDNCSHDMLPTVSNDSQSLPNYECKYLYCCIQERVDLVLLYN